MSLKKKYVYGNMMILNLKFVFFKRWEYDQRT